MYKRNQATTSDRKPGIYPRSLLYLGLVMAVLPVLILGVGSLLDLIYSHILFLQILILATVGLVSLWIALRGDTVYYSPFILSLFYLISYPMRVLDIELNLDQWLGLAGGVYYSEVGAFQFTVDAYWEFVLLASVGMAGVVIGQLLVRFWLRPGKTTSSPPTLTTGPQLAKWVWLWFAATLALTLINMRLGIGALTIVPVALPFRLTGILNMTRSALLPLVGLWLFGLALQQENRRAAVRILVMNVLLGSISIPATLSKAAIFFPLIPYVLCMFVDMRKSPLTRGLMRWTVVLILVLAPLSVIGVNWLREYTVYSGALPSFSELADWGVKPGDLFVWENPLRHLYRHTVLRVTGGSEAMAVLASPPVDLASLLAWIINPPGARTLDWGVIQDVWGIDVVTGRILPMGKAFGLFGFWYLSHNMIVLFAASTIYAALVLLVESIFRRVGNAGLAAGIGFTLSSLIWEFTADIMSLYPYILVVLFLILRMLSQSTRRSRVFVKPKRSQIDTLLASSDNSSRPKIPVADPRVVPGDL